MKPKVGISKLQNNNFAKYCKNRERFGIDLSVKMRWILKTISGYRIPYIRQQNQYRYTRLVFTGVKNTNCVEIHRLIKITSCTVNDVKVFSLPIPNHTVRNLCQTIYPEKEKAVAQKNINGEVENRVEMRIPDMKIPNKEFGKIFIGTSGIAFENLKHDTESSLHLYYLKDSIYIKIVAKGPDKLKNAVMKVTERIQNIIDTTQVIEIPQMDLPKQEFRKIFIGEDGKDIKNLGTDCNMIRIDSFNDLFYVVVNVIDVTKLDSVVQRVQDRILSIKHTTGKVCIPGMKFSNDVVKQILIGTKGKDIMKLGYDTESILGIRTDTVNDSLYLIVQVKDRHQLESTVEKVKDRIQNIMLTTEIMKVPETDLSNFELEKLFIGESDIEKLKQENEVTHIIFERLNESFNVVVNVKNTEKLQNAVNKVKRRIQNILLTTGKVDIPQLKFPIKDFKQLFIGDTGKLIHDLKMETDSAIWFESNDSALIVKVKEPEKLENAVLNVINRIKTIIKSTDIVKIPETDLPKSEFQYLFVGENGRTIKNLTRESGSKNIRIISVNDCLYVIVHVTDPQKLENALQKVKDKIQNIFHTTKTLHIPIESEYIKSHLIGEAGNAVKELKIGTNASYIRFRTLNDYSYLVVNVTDADQLKSTVEKVEKRIQEIKNKSKTLDIPTSQLEPEDFKQLFFGDYGKAIKKLTEETQSNIEFMGFDNTYHVSVTVKDGDNLSQAVAKVKDRMEFIIKTTEKIDLPTKHITDNIFKKLFVGLCGKEINQLMKETEAMIRIRFNKFKNNLYIIVNVSDVEKLENAVTKVKERMNNTINRNSTINITSGICSRRKLNDLHLGVYREAVWKLRRETQSTIWFEICNDHSFYVHISVEDADKLENTVMKVKDGIRTIIRTQEKVDIPATLGTNLELDKSLIDKIRKLRRETEAEIQLIPNKTSPYVLVTVKDVYKLSQVVMRVEERLQQ